MDEISIGTHDIDTTRALFDGSVTVDGVASTRMDTRATLADTFAAFTRDEIDVSEFGLTFLLRALEDGASYVALPVFPTRIFRHSSVFVSARSGIEQPSDLVDRRIGEFGVYGQDSGVWIKGVLMDEYGFRPERNRWVIGGLDFPAKPFEFTTQVRPDGIEIGAAPEGRTLSGMLVDGEIDALFTANAPQPFLDGDPAVRRLFTDYEPAERDWFARTGIFPMMHAVAVRRDLLDANPGLAQSVYDAFREAKDDAIGRYRQARRLYQVATMLPWANAVYEQDVDLMGEDWWPYGIAANRTALDTFLRYHHEQGLSRRRWTVEEVFAAELLDT